MGGFGIYRLKSMVWKGAFQIDKYVSLFFSIDGFIFIYLNVRCCYCRLGGCAWWKSAFWNIVKVIVLIPYLALSRSRSPHLQLSLHVLYLMKYWILFAHYSMTLPIFVVIFLRTKLQYLNRLGETGGHLAHPFRIRGLKSNYLYPAVVFLIIPQFKLGGLLKFI